MTVNVSYIGMQARTISVQRACSGLSRSPSSAAFQGQDSLLQSCRPSSDTRLTELPEHRGSA